jgi:DNA-binding FrmR family transcriptional regulator
MSTRDTANSRQALAQHSTDAEAKLSANMIHREESGKSHGYVADKQRVAARLKRVEGQVRAITRMVEDDTYCIDVLTQISACDKALKSVALLLLNDHLNHCVRTAVSQGGDIADDKLKEAEDAIARLVRS